MHARRIRSACIRRSRSRGRQAHRLAQPHPNSRGCRDIHSIARMWFPAGRRTVPPACGPGRRSPMPMGRRETLRAAVKRARVAFDPPFARARALPKSSWRAGSPSHRGTRARRPPQYPRYRCCRPNPGACSPMRARSPSPGRRPTGPPTKGLRRWSRRE